MIRQLVIIIDGNSFREFDDDFDDDFGGYDIRQPEEIALRINEPYTMNLTVDGDKF